MIHSSISLNIQCSFNIYMYENLEVRKKLEHAALRFEIHEYLHIWAEINGKTKNKTSKTYRCHFGFWWNNRTVTILWNKEKNAENNANFIHIIQLYHNH